MSHLDKMTIDEMWNRVKASRSPGFRGVGAERVFKAGLRWGSAYGSDDREDVLVRFANAFRVEGE